MYFERSNVRSLLVVFTANFCNLSCFLVAYSTIYHFCFWFLFAPFCFGVHLVPLSAIIIWFWLSFQYTIIKGLFDSLHQSQLGCNFKKRGAIFPYFSANFHFRLLPLTLIITVFLNTLQPLKLVVFLVTFGCIPNSNWLHY